MHWHHFDSISGQMAFANFLNASLSSKTQDWPPLKRELVLKRNAEQNLVTLLLAKSSPRLPNTCMYLIGKLFCPAYDSHTLFFHLEQTLASCDSSYGSHPEKSSIRSRSWGEKRWHRAEFIWGYHHAPQDKYPVAACAYWGAWGKEKIEAFLSHRASGWVAGKVVGLEK